MGTATSGRTIKSDETLLRIVEFVHERGGAGVTEIASGLDIAKSTVWAHLATLEERGYVVNDEGTYTLGLQFLRHGVHTQHSHAIYHLAKEKVTYLAQETGERAWCMVEENGLAYYLCGAEGAHPVHPPVQVGACVYLHQIAGGKAIMAYLPEERIREIIDRYGLPANTGNTITDAEELFADLERIRERGYSFNKEESLRGLHAIGAPVRDHDGNVAGSLSVSGPANRLKGRKLEDEFAELLLGVTNELEINLTYSGPRSMGSNERSISTNDVSRNGDVG
ncbi:MAG: IclR family transcriptional regulator [Salinigranum sp.]